LRRGTGKRYSAQLLKNGAGWELWFQNPSIPLVQGARSSSTPTPLLFIENARSFRLSSSILPPFKREGESLSETRPFHYLSISDEERERIGINSVYGTKKGEGNL
jgi:hypothetical protein